MAKTIENISMYLEVTPYKFEEKEYNLLNVTVAYRRGKGFEVYYKPGWRTSFGWGCIMYGAGNRLDSGATILVKSAPRNSAKELATMNAALKMATLDIRYFFDHRDWDKLDSLLKTVALYGYNEDVKSQIHRDRQDENKQSNKTDETMTQNVKAADLIGKTILAGSAAKYVVKSVENGNTLVTDFSANGNTMEAKVSMDMYERMAAAGKWTLADETAEAPKSEHTAKPKADGFREKVSGQTASRTTEEPAEKSAPRQEAPKSEQPKHEAKGKLAFSTYVNKKGKVCAKISGFSEDDPAYVNGVSLRAAACYEIVGSGKVFFLAFGHRYVDAAKQVFELLNEGKPLGECKAVVDASIEQRQQKRDERKQRNAGYSDKDVADMIVSFLQTGTLPEGVMNNIPADFIESIKKAA